MGILRVIKSDYEMYENTKLECLVAIQRDDCKLIKAYFKVNKGKSRMPDAIVKGYKFIKDEEFDSIKIDFSNECSFEIRHLIKAK